MNIKPKILHLGICEYSTVYDYMKNFTRTRSKDAIDEVLFLEHLAVYTQGQAGKPEHIINLDSIANNNIPIVQSDRGGQITYHGPGQLIIYFMLDLNRMRLGIKDLVCKTEDFLINYLAKLNINANKICKAPGVYVNGNKIASLGFRVKNGCTYHGIAFNINMDLSPFNYINPCGFKELNMTQLKEFIPDITVEQVSFDLTQSITTFLNFR
jgi:lipoyl(octanoyl) transferase